MQITDILFLAACAVSLIGGLYFGYRRGFLRGVTLGRDVEFVAMALSMKALEKNENYVNIFTDMEVQYKRVMAETIQDLRK